jgi:hypothetical protein
MVPTCWGECTWRITLSFASLTSSIGGVLIYTLAPVKLSKSSPAPYWCSGSGKAAGLVPRLEIVDAGKSDSTNFRTQSSV